MALTAPDAAALLGVAFTFALAGWLLWLDFESRVHRSFALFLFVHGMARLCVLASRMGDAAFWEAMAQYFMLAQVPALAYFLLAYLAPRTLPWGVVSGAVLALGVLAEAAFLLDHCLSRCVGDAGGIVYGPLALLSHALPVALVLVGLFLVRKGAASAPDARRDGVLLVAGAFLLAALSSSWMVVGLYARLGWGSILAAISPPGWVTAPYLLWVAGIPLALGGIAFLAFLSAREGSRLRAGLLALLALAASGSGLLRGSAAGAGGLAEDAGRVLVALWELAVPGVVAYAILRHHFLGLDVRLKWALSRTPLVAAAALLLLVAANLAGTRLATGLVGAFAGVAVGGFVTWAFLASDHERPWWRFPRGPLAAVILACLFIAAQIAETFLSTTYGALLGSVATGLVLFAITPLQRLGERFANGVMPGTKPIADMSHPERQDFYRAQAALAWADGNLSRKERRMLDHLRERLALPLEEAARLEQQALGSGGASHLP